MKAATWRIAAACLAAWAATAAGEDRGIPMTVTEPAGLARTGEPICGGIPVPPGKFKKDQAFAVLVASPGRSDGPIKPLPCQVVPLVVAPDGSLRWVLVDFQDDLPAGGTKHYLLRPGRSKAGRPPKAVTIKDQPDGVTVDTGAVRFVVSRTKPFGLLAEARAGGRPIVTGSAATYTDGLDGKTYSADKPQRVEVEYAGPMRATVCVRGRFVRDEKNRFQYVARVTAWAGRSAVHVKYSLCNSNPDHYAWRVVRNSTVALTLAARPRAGTLGAGEWTTPLAAADGWVASGLRRGTAGAIRTGHGGRVARASTVKRGAPPGGWILARLQNGGLWATDLYFADDPARRLAIQGDRLLLSGVIERWVNPAKNRSGREIGAPYAHTARVLCDCSHLSSQYVLDLAPPAAPDRLEALAAAAREPLHLFASPDAYLHGDALPLGPFATQADELACYKTWGWAYDRRRIPKTPVRTYPRFYRGTDNHYTPEEDPLDQLLIMYMRTGARAYLDNARSWANYWMDLYAWRTDGWRWKDGGVWWQSGPKGSRPQRAADPVSGRRERIPAAWSKQAKAPWTLPWIRDNAFLADAKSCYCHNWGQGLLAWYCLTGQRDALEAALDRVEQDIDTQRRAFRKAPGKADNFSRDFNRASYLAHAARTVVPDDAFVRQASDYYAKVYLARPTKEPRGLVNGARKWRRGADLPRYVGEPGLAALKASGCTFDAKTGRMTDATSGRKWYVIHNPHTWMFPPLSRAMDLYGRLTGDEDATDWTIAYGQAAARVLYQPHGALSYGRMLVDFPRRGVARDYAAWVSGPDNPNAEGIVMSGFLARFHPDVCARAYALCGEPLLKQRAFAFWRGGSHRGYQSKTIKPLDRVGMWLNYHSDHDGQLDFVGRTFYEWAHPRKDDKPPEAVRDLKVARAGGRVTVTFTAPADAGGGRVARYQLKAAEKPIVDYEMFLKRFNAFEDGKACNWWMAANLSGEPAPGPAGRAVSFTVAGAPGTARYFAVRSFDDSANRAALSNVAEAKP